MISDKERKRACRYVGRPEIRVRKDYVKNHDEKLRDIARSVLPSEARKAARDNLRAIKQKNRRSINRQLARIDSIDIYYEDPRVEDLEFYPDAEIGYAVGERRGADKLSVMRWAEERTKQEGITDPHDRYNYAKQNLPKNLAGRHALTHIATIDGFCDGGIRSFRGCDDHNPYRYRSSKPRQERSFDDLVEHFTKLLAQPGQHQALNSMIKRLHTKSHVRNIPGTFAQYNGRYGYITEKIMCAACDRPRVLAGAHDVEAWVADVFFPRSDKIVTHSWWRAGFGVTHTEPKYVHHSEWRTAAEKFL